jgi:hypothetical protein
MQNNKRYWLRGITVAFILVVAWTALGYYLTNGTGDPLPEIYSLFTSFFAFIPASLTNQLLKIFCTSSGPFSCLGLGIIFILILTLLELIATGAILGWIYGKIKNRNRV